MYSCAGAEPSRPVTVLPVTVQFSMTPLLTPAKPPTQVRPLMSASFSVRLRMTPLFCANIPTIMYDGSVQLMPVMVLPFPSNTPVKAVPVNSSTSRAWLSPKPSGVQSAESVMSFIRIYLPSISPAIARSSASLVMAV